MVRDQHHGRVDALWPGSVLLRFRGATVLVQVAQESE